MEDSFGWSSGVARPYRMTAPHATPTWNTEKTTVGARSQTGEISQSQAPERANTRARSGFRMARDAQWDARNALGHLRPATVRNRLHRPGVAVHRVSAAE